MASSRQPPEAQPLEALLHEPVLQTGCVIVRQHFRHQARCVVAQGVAPDPGHLAVGRERPDAGVVAVELGCVQADFTRVDGVGPELVERSRHAGDPGARPHPGVPLHAFEHADPVAVAEGVRVAAPERLPQILPRAHREAADGRGGGGGGDVVDHRGAERAAHRVGERRDIDGVRLDRTEPEGARTVLGRGTQGDPRVLGGVGPGGGAARAFRVGHQRVEPDGEGAQVDEPDLGERPVLGRRAVAQGGHERGDGVRREGGGVRPVARGAGLAAQLQGVAERHGPYGLPAAGQTVRAGRGGGSVAGRDGTDDGVSGVELNRDGRFRTGAGPGRGHGAGACARACAPVGDRPGGGSGVRPRGGERVVRAEGGDDRPRAAEALQGAAEQLLQPGARETRLRRGEGARHHGAPPW